MKYLDYALLEWNTCDTVFQLFELYAFITNRYRYIELL